MPAGQRPSARRKLTLQHRSGRVRRIGRSSGTRGHPVRQHRRRCLQPETAERHARVECGCRNRLALDRIRIRGVSNHAVTSSEDGLGPFDDRRVDARCDLRSVRVQRQPRQNVRSELFFANAVALKDERSGDRADA